MREPRVETDRERFLRTTAAASENARVPVEVTVEIEDPFEAYRRARDERGGAALRLDRRGVQA